jgi:hypothetical protein
MTSKSDLKTVPLGAFEVDEKLVVSDPCYDRDTWCAIFGIECVPGTWHGQTLEGMSLYGHRSWELLAFHETVTDDSVEWEKFGDIGVDSGQAGIFNDAVYPKGDTGEYGDLKTFYGRACDATMDEENPIKRAGVLPEGVVSSAGYGDGSYEVFVKKNGDGLVNACRVVFIDEDEEA